MKKVISCLLMAGMAATLFTGCGNQDSSSQGSNAAAGFDWSHDISVIAREEGSGTRSAFVELFGIEEEDANGETVDKTTAEAIQTNSTAVMMTTVSGNEYAIGYISLGSLNDTVKGLKIDGADATVENIKSGAYKVSRPFNIATKADVSEVAQDFIDFIMSTEGQQVIADAGYIGADDAQPYAGSKPSGKVVVAGSSSVTSVMEKLKEAYQAINSGAEIEVQQTDSSSGMTSAIEGACDIGMASRELKDSELSAGLTPTVIATDGIAVIVHNDNPLDTLTSAQVKEIFTGAATTWEGFKAE